MLLFLYLCHGNIKTLLETSAKHWINCSTSSKNAGKQNLSPSDSTYTQWRKISSKHQLSKLYLSKMNSESVLRVKYVWTLIYCSWLCFRQRKATLSFTDDFIACRPPLITNKWQGVTGNNQCLTQDFQVETMMQNQSYQWCMRLQRQIAVTPEKDDLQPGVHSLQQHRFCCVEAMGLGRVSRNREASGKHQGCGWEARQFEKHPVMYDSLCCTTIWQNMRVQLCSVTAWSSN